MNLYGYMDVECDATKGLDVRELFYALDWVKVSLLYLTRSSNFTRDPPNISSELYKAL